MAYRFLDEPHSTISQVPCGLQGFKFADAETLCGLQSLRYVVHKCAVFRIPRTQIPNVGGGSL